MNLTHTHHHTAIEVRELDGAVVWYRDHLGLRFERSFELPEAGIKIAYMVSDALRIELLERSVRSSEESADTGAQEFRPSMHICFEVDDIESAAAELRRRGVDFAQAPRRIDPAGVKNLWIRAFEGHLIEFLEVLG